MVTLQNGVPWWYFQRLGGQYADRVVKSVDPRGVLFNSIDPDRLNRVHRVSGRHDCRAGRHQTHRG